MIWCIPFLLLLSYLASPAGSYVSKPLEEFPVTVTVLIENSSLVLPICLLKCAVNLIVTGR